MVRSYRVFRCWPSEFTALPELDANANAIAIEIDHPADRGLGARSRRDRAGRNLSGRSATMCASGSIPVSTASASRTFEH